MLAFSPSVSSGGQLVFAFRCSGVLKSVSDTIPFLGSYLYKYYNYFYGFVVELFQQVRLSEQKQRSSSRVALWEMLNGA